jgi:plasmid maintenance system antidote protein VapI
LCKIVNQRGAVTPDMALRLSRAFDTTPDFWLNLQGHYDLWHAQTASDDWQKVEPFPEHVLHDTPSSYGEQAQLLNKFGWNSSVRIS